MSTRSEVYKHITANSEFNVLLSRTMFPLGPQDDARGILEHLGEGGEGLSRHVNPGKWNCSEQLFSDFWGLIKAKILARIGTRSHFECLISQFYMRRTIPSSFENEWIMNQPSPRPVPRIILPRSDAFTRLNDPRALKQTRETLGNTMKRADHMRFLA